MSTDNKNLGIGKTVAFLLLAITLIVSIFIYRVNQPRFLSIEDLRAKGAIVFKEPRNLPSFKLSDQTNAAFDNARLQGKWHLLYPGFTHCPDICPATMSHLKTFWQSLSDSEKEKLQIILFSIDPQRDSAERLADYIQQFNADFIGLRGNLAETYKLAKALNIAFTIIHPGEHKQHYNVDHSTNLVVLNPKGEYQGFFKPPFEPLQLKLLLHSTQMHFN